MDSHIAKPTVDMFQILNINLIELGGGGGGGTFLYRAPAFRFDFDFSTAVARRLKPSRATAVPNINYKYIRRYLKVC